MDNKNRLHKIKVWDLLKKIWSIDIINISKLDIVHLKNIEDISWKIFMQSISDEEIYIRFEDISYISKNICDYCGNWFNQKMILENLSHRYAKHTNKVDAQDDIRPINNDITIDIITPITQAIMINCNIQNICSNCKDKTNKWDDDYDQYETTKINHPIFIS